MPLQFPELKNRLSGFALISSLLLMSMILLLLVSLATFVQVELNVSSSARALEEARNNAKLGLSVAIGQLQRYAGADQRITTPATTVYPNKNVFTGTGPLYDDPNFGYRAHAQVSSSRSYLNSVETYLTPQEQADWDQSIQDWWNQGRNPHWLAVYDSSMRVDAATNPSGNPASADAQIYETDDPDRNGGSTTATKYGEFARAQKPIWLVSGNETFTFDPRSDARPSDYLTPDQVFADPEDADSDMVWLVGAQSATTSDNSTDGLDGRVKAPKVRLDSYEDALTGHYAYWVGDESTKANFALKAVDPDTASGSDYYKFLQSPQRVGWENIEGFSGASIDVYDEDFAKVVDARQIAVMDPSLADNPATEDVNENVVARNFHSLTAYSKGLLTDTALGGLKKDLTRYLEYGEGLNDSDTIPDPDRYDVDDPRFAAWGGSNEGFPHQSVAARDGVPEWGQVRDWYQEEADEGSGRITPSKSTSPVITYLSMGGGVSYDGASRRFRWHWTPCIVLWNPFDASLGAASYEIELEFGPYFGQMHVVNPSPDLSLLQSQSGANWTADPNPDVDENGDGDASNDWRFTDTDGQIQIRLNPDLADEIDVSSGPFVADGDIEDGITDAFGRLYYRLENVNPAEIFLSYGNNAKRINGTYYYGPLGDRNSGANIGIHHSQSSPALNRPLDRRMRLRISTSFQPGESKVLTLDSNQEWTSGSALNMGNDYDPDYPPYAWFDIVEVVNGPASANAEELKWFLRDTPGSSFATPGVSMSINGEAVFETSSFGMTDAYKAWFYIAGRDFNSIGDARTIDSDGDGLSNEQESNPKFISQWRNLYDFDTFDDYLRTQSGSETVASNWAYLETYYQPMTGSGSIGWKDLHRNASAFSRFNFGANYFDVHPLVDAYRSMFGNKNFNQLMEKEGLMNFEWFNADNVSSYGGATELKWDDNQANGIEGYVLITPRNYENNINGLSELTVRHARRINSDVLSLGQFQQVNLSPYYWQPAFPIGNSFAPPYTDREAIAGIHSRPVGTMNDGSNSSFINMPYAGYRPNNKDEGVVRTMRNNSNTRWSDVSTPGNTMLDLSYLLNENIWDHYFLSGVTNGTNLNEALPNQRLQLIAEPDSLNAGEIRDFDTAAANFQNVGAFNVNSTSVEAWKALLTAFRDLKLGSDENPDETTPIVRTLTPLDGPIELLFDDSFGLSMDMNDTGAVSNYKDYSKALKGFRYFNDAMIQALAERIVDEVRLRGPFYSVADFVNRRLVAPEGSRVDGSDWFLARTDGKVNDPNASDLHPDFMNPSYDPFIGLQGLSGTIQRAIQVSGINGGVNHPSMGLDGSQNGLDNDRIYSVRFRSGGDADYVGQSVPNFVDGNPIGGSSNLTEKHSQIATMRSHLDSEHVAGAPAGEAGQLFDGIAGMVTQADILSMIGPALTARGDTFIIRTYGDSINPLTNEVTAKVWLEAVVQRVIEPVDPADVNDPEDKWRPLTRFGRKFEVVSMRWLAEDEI